MRVKSESEVIQSCLTFCDPMNCSLPGSSVHGVFQARVLEWGAIAFSRATRQLGLNYLKIHSPTRLVAGLGGFQTRMANNLLVGLSFLTSWQPQGGWTSYMATQGSKCKCPGMQTTQAFADLASVDLETSLPLHSTG